MRLKYRWTTRVIPDTYLERFPPQSVVRRGTLHTSEIEFAIEGMARDWLVFINGKLNCSCGSLKGAKRIVEQRLGEFLATRFAGVEPPEFEVSELKYPYYKLQAGTWNFRHHGKAGR